MNIVLITNILTPYRSYFFEKLHQNFSSKNDNLTILVMAEGEHNRPWKFKDLKKEFTILLPGKCIKITKGIFLHTNKMVKHTLKKLNPDIVVAAGSYTFPTIWRTISLRRSLGYKVLFWSESHLDEHKEYNFVIKLFRNMLRRIIYSQFDGFWYSGKMSLSFIETYCRENAIKIFCPNIINEELYKDRSEKITRQEIADMYGFDSNKYIFTCVARLSKEKGLENFIELFSRSSICKNNSVILLIGEGPREKELRQIISKCGINAILIGQLPQNEVKKVLEASDCFCLPSFSDPNPLSCIEALCVGLPLIISKHVGNKYEVIREGKNGYIFDFSHPEDAVEKLEKLITSSDGWRKTAKDTSLKIYKSIYDLNTQLERIVLETKAVKV